MGLLSKLIGLAINKVYYFSKNLIRIYFVYSRIPSIQALLHRQHSLNVFSVNKLHKPWGQFKCVSPSLLYNAKLHVIVFYLSY